MFGVNLLAGEEQVPIDQVPVELGAVNAGETGFASHFHPAPAAHAGAIDHHRIQADHRAHAKGPRGKRAELHHDCRADGIYATDSLGCILIQQFIERLGDQGFLAGAAVVGGDDMAVGNRREPVGPEEQILAARSLDCDDLAARFVKRPCDGYR